MSEQSAEYDRIKRDVEQARVALAETHWWQFIKRQDAADRYKRVLLAGALWEARNRPIPPEATNP